MRPTPISVKTNIARLGFRGREARLDSPGSADERLFQALRRRISTRRFSSEQLKRAFQALAGPAGNPGYDVLDLLVAGLFGEAPREPQISLGPDGVAYQPTPARDVLALIDRAGLGPSTRLVDLGSGLGLVPLLAALLSGVPALGIEIEPAYVDCARRRAQALGLKNVEFLVGDLANCPLAPGDLYFLYSPLRGAALQSLLDRLRALARPLLLASLGPCSRSLAQQPWLQRREGPGGDDQIQVFEGL